MVVNNHVEWLYSTSSTSRNVYHVIILNYIKYSCIVFCVKISEYSQIIYCLQEKSTYFGLEVSVVYVILSLYVLNLFLCAEYILRQNVSKKQTRKILNYIKFLCAKLF